MSRYIRDPISGSILPIAGYSIPDNELSDTSENCVQNKVVTNAIKGTLGTYQNSSNNAVTYPGILTAGGASVYITIDLGRSMSHLSDRTITVSSMVGSLRGLTGYLRNDLANTELVDISDVTITATTYETGIVVKFDFSSAISGATNNTPVMYTGKYEITIS